MDPDKLTGIIKTAANSSEPRHRGRTIISPCCVREVKSEIRDSTGGVVENRFGSTPSHDSQSACIS